MVMMGRSALIVVLVASSLGLLSSLELKKWHRRQMTAEKLRRVSEALEQAEGTLIKFQERHDRILFHINAHYLCRAEMGTALRGARKAMDEALQFCVQLRSMQMKILASYTSTAEASDQIFTICSTNYADH